ALGCAMLGECYHAQGRLREAEDNLDTALAMLREAGDRGTAAVATGVLAEVYRDRGRYREAMSLAEDALRETQDTGDKRFEADVLNIVASIHYRLGDPASAADFHQRALTAAGGLENRSP